jgi:putative ABC transport system permease protein
MIKFLFKGILRDKRRSLLPIIIITIGVFLTVLLSGYMRGMMGDVTDQNARFETGHVKVMTRAYLENIDQLPNDLAILNASEVVSNLESDFPEVTWVKRIRFGGLIDAPGENDTSKGQGPAAGFAIDLLHPEKGEVERMKIPNSLVSGSVPTKRGEAIIGDAFAKKLGLKVGDEITYFGSTVNGSMSFQNFTVSGTIVWGMAVLDRGSIIIDIADAQQMLDMEDGAGEILGYLPREIYKDEKATEIADRFNAGYAADEDEFAPVMKTLKQQNDLAALLDYADAMAGIFIVIFVLAMSVVLWNTGLLGGLRRYKEFGIRLALGESKGQIYRSMILEAALIGLVGSVIGTALGLSGVLYLQEVGIDISELSKNAGMMMPSRVKAEVTANLFFIGFIPGVLAMVLGNMLSGIGIYRRETATLFKDLEV